MSEKTVTISLDLIIKLLTDLGDEEKEIIFEKVFLKEDREPLSKKEKKEILNAENEFQKGETIKWPFGK